MATVENLLIRIQAVGGRAAAAEMNVAKGGISGIGKAALAMAGAFGLGKAIDSYVEFQRQQRQLITQTGASRQEMDHATKGILDMAASVGTGPKSLAQAMYHVESTGKRGDAALRILRIAAEGAKVGNANLVDVTNALTSAVVSGIPGVQNIDQAMGMLNATVGAGDMTMQDLTAGMHGTLATFKLAGLQMRDFGAAMAVLGDNNIRGAQAATGLSMAIRMIQRMGGPAKKAAEGLGLSQTQLADSLRKPRGLLNMLDLLHEKMKDKKPSEQAATLMQIFGARSGKSILVLYDQMERLRTKYHEVETGGKRFASDWQETQKTLSFWIDKAKALAEVLGIRLAQALETAGKWIIGLVNGFKQGNPLAIALVSTVIGLAAAFTAYGVAVGVATVATALFNIVSKANIWVLIAAAIIAVGVALVKAYQHSRSFRETVKQIGSVLVSIGKIGVSVFNTIKNIVTVAIRVIMGVVRGFITFFRIQWMILSFPVRVVFGVIRSIIVSGFNIIKGTVQAAVKIIKAVLEFMWTPMKDTLGPVIRWIGKALNNVFGFFKKLGQAIADFAGGMWEPIASAFRSVIQSIADVWNSIPFIHGIHVKVGPLKIDIPGLPEWHPYGGGVPSNYGATGRGGSMPHPGAIGAQTGGFVTRAGFFDVGEKGPERVLLPAGGLVVPNALFDRLGRNADQPLENHVTVMVGPHQLAKAIQWSLTKEKSLR